MIDKGEIRWARWGIGAVWKMKGELTKKSVLTKTNCVLG